MFKTFRILFFIFVLFLANIAFSEESKIISDINTIKKLKCTVNLLNGSIDEYDNTVDYYTFQNDNIYSSNLNNLFGDITKDPKKVLKLKITDDYITFKDRLYKFEGSYYKWIKINRNTGEYIFSAKNDFGFFFKRANCKGFCTIEK